MSGSAENNFLHWHFSKAKAYLLVNKTVDGIVYIMLDFCTLSSHTWKESKSEIWKCTFDWEKFTSSWQGIQL